MQLDTETATIMMRSAERANAMAEEATRRVVELMQEAIEYRERIAELEGDLGKWLEIYERSPSGLTVAVPVYQIERLLQNAKS